jgi:hypothetical protein
VNFQFAGTGGKIIGGKHGLVCTYMYCSLPVGIYVYIDRSPIANELLLELKI